MTARNSPIRQSPSGCAPAIRCTSRSNPLISLGPTCSSRRATTPGASPAASLRSMPARPCASRASAPPIEDEDNGAEAMLTFDADRLVDTERGLLDRRIFIEPEIYEEEQRRIFARCWLFLCHDS